MKFELLSLSSILLLIPSQRIPQSLAIQDEPVEWGYEPGSPLESLSRHKSLHFLQMLNVVDAPADHVPALKKVQHVHASILCRQGNMSDTHIAKHYVQPRT